KVDDQARKMDEVAEHRGTYSLPLDVPPNTRVDLRLEMPNLSVMEADAVLVWRGRPNAASSRSPCRPRHLARRQSGESALPWRASPPARFVSRSRSPRRALSSAPRCPRPKRYVTAGP